MNFEFISCPDNYENNGEKPPEFLVIKKIDAGKSKGGNNNVAADFKIEKSPN